MKFIINGKFLTDRMQGIVRYARELILAIDNYLDNEKDMEFILVCPNNSKDIPNLKNIKVEIIEGEGGIKWEQKQLKKYVKKHKNYVPINFCNVAPLNVQPGVTTIHDVMYRTDFKHAPLKIRISALWHRFQYQYIAKHEQVILTDSYFSKEQIEKYYPKSKGKIEVVYCGYDHVKRYKENVNWNKDYPFLEPKQYFFSLATLAENKNGKWIVEVAKQNPDCVFAIGGKFYNDESLIKDLPQNIHLLGFISDEDACSLIKNCRAFIFPSIIEGFGLPPLEALALGAQVIASNSASMPEVLGNSVHYIDPYNYDVNLDELLKEKVESPKELLDKFTYINAANTLMDILKNRVK